MIFRKDSENIFFIAALSMLLLFSWYSFINNSLRIPVLVFEFPFLIGAIEESCTIDDIYTSFTSDHFI